jgi:hypothetical protein
VDKLVNEVIYTLLQYKRCNERDVKNFQKLKHNNDLCPGFQKKIEYIIQMFTKYRTITYDIQGFKDDGTDIVARCTEYDDTKYTCFQIKSHSDMEKPDYLTKIKCQANDTMNGYSSNLSDYYIILCCDINNGSIKNKVRQVEAAFSKTSHIHIIEPEYAYTFLKLGEIQIDALIKSKLSDEDIIFRQALNIVHDMTPTERGILFYLIWRNLDDNKGLISLSEIIDSNFIKFIYKHVPDYDKGWFYEDDVIDDNYSDDSEDEYFIRGFNIEQRIDEDIDTLEEYYIYQDKNGYYEVVINRVYPLVSLMLDGIVRYEFDENEMLLYMMDLFGTMRGYEGHYIQNDEID